MRSLLLSLAASTALGQPVSAQTWDAWANEFYVVGQSSDDERRCGLVSDFEFEGRADIRLAMQLRDEFVWIGLYSFDWSALPEGEPVVIGLGFDDAQGENLIVGYGGGGQLEYRNGFMARFDVRAASLFASSSSLWVMSAMADDPDNVATVADLPLDQSAEAVAALRRCHAYAERQRAEREAEEARYIHVPRDPFASGD